MANLPGQPKTPPTTLPSFQIVGQIAAPEIKESSGLVMSRRHPGVFWTHNDSGNSATLFAITREGKLISSFRIEAPNVDWEDLAIDDAGHLYLADIGNNLLNRSQVQVYRIPEPEPRGESTGAAIKPDRVYKLAFPGKAFDAESLCILKESGYILSKHRDGSDAGIYRFKLDANDRPVDLERIATLPQRIPITGADISADGRWLAIMTIGGPTVYEINGDPARAGTGASRSMIFLDPGCESVCFTPDGLLATTEGRRMVFFPISPDKRQ